MSYAPSLYKIFDTEGELFCIGIILLIILLIIVLQNLILKKFKKESPKFLKDIKDNLMWSAILRVAMEGYSQLIL